MRSYYFILIIHFSDRRMGARMLTLSTRQINKIPIAQRIILAEKLWESIPEHSDRLDLSPSQKAELDARLDALEKGRENTTSWAQVKAKMRARRMCR
jgi:putative addiction module component (TIGR02574 family)